MTTAEQVKVQPRLKARYRSEMKGIPIVAGTKVSEVIGAKVPGRNFDYFLTQRGMFSYTGLSGPQVDELREQHAVYLIRSGRICVAGLNTGNVERTAAAMAAVLRG
jgi:aromatic-amino-acid transaminase